MRKTDKSQSGSEDTGKDLPGTTKECGFRYSCDRWRGRGNIMTTVAMDVRVLAGQSQRTGIAQYMACLLAEYLKDRRRVELQGLSYASSIQGFEGIPVTVIPRKKGVPWQSVLLPWHLRNHHYDVFHGPSFSLPPWVKMPKIVTVHDAAFYRMPEFVRADTVKYLARMVPRAFREANRIIVPSREVRDDVLEMAPWVQERNVVVISLGADRLKDMLPRSSSPNPVATPYLLHVGTIEPRKNLEFLLRVFSQLIRMKDVPHHLVLAGANGWNNEKFWRSYEHFRFKDRVHLLGYVSDEETVRLYQGAAVYLSPSHYEGFGLGSFEALWHGCPVISSPTGGANDYLIEGLSVLPIREEDGDDEVWADKIHELVLQSPTIDHELLPTWENTYRQHAALYHEVSHGTR